MVRCCYQLRRVVNDLLAVVRLVMIYDVGNHDIVFQGRRVSRSKCLYNRSSKNNISIKIGIGASRITKV